MITLPPIPRYSIDDIWVFIYEKGRVTAKDLEERFFNPQKKSRREKNKDYISRGYLYKYKGILEDEGKIARQPMKDERGKLVRPHRDYFFVPEEYYEDVETLIARNKAHSIVDNLTLKELIARNAIWEEIQMVITEMKKMDYTDEEIQNRLEKGLNDLHSDLVDQIVQDGEEEEQKNK